MTDSAGVIAVVSTLISSIALVGVMVGLLLQSRQLGLDRAQTYRAFQLELIRMQLDNPEFPDMPSAFTDDPVLRRQYGYMHWRVKYTEFGFQAGEISEQSVHARFSILFRSTQWKDWWTLAGATYQVDANTRRKRQYLAIIDEEYRASHTRSASS